MVSHGIDRTGAASGSGEAQAAFINTLLDADTVAAALGALNVATFVQTLLDDADADAFIETLADGATAETAPAVGDLVLISDVSANDGRKMTLENALKVVNGLTADATPDSAADYLLTYDASASGAKKVLVQDFPLPRGHLAGGVLSNNGSDATNDIDIAAGEARDSTNAVNIRWSALTKQLDAAFAAGTNAGGRSADALANGTWHVYAIRRDSDGSGDILFDTDAASPSMPAGYTYFRRIGSIIRAAAAIVAFNQKGDVFMRSTPASGDLAGAMSTANRTLVTLSVPTGIKVRAIMGFAIESSAGSQVAAVLTDPDLADTTVNMAFNEDTGTSGEQRGGYAECGTNTSAQIGVRANVAVNGLINTFGWYDRRGRDD